MYVSESFETVLKNRELKLDKKDLGNDGIAFLGLYSEEDEFPFSVVFDDSQDRTDYQITYEGIGNGKDLGLDLFDVLFTINRLNQELVAYYTLLMDPDGELFIRYVGRVTPFETFTLYELLVIGSKIASEVRRTLLELKDENDI
ncbi:hypothetical protein [uncultured Granulicatella sp.]|uniref:hypothetical protein n=1 Tax=uncultured Granulicatella sp. TaxID=316089 RepID=UPI00280592C4|nr:hypothetical protein [uncultured Granulicatella sp.]